jgi:CelD/BcsL family acetyltransferase involved in cellulose biosynthesis
VSVHAAVIDDDAGLEAIRGAWDELAVRAGKPLSAPGWVLPWWRHAAPEGAVARVVAISDDDRLVAVAPLFCARGGKRRATYEVMSASLAPPASLLVDRDAGREAVGELARALEALEPKPLALRFWDRTGAAGLAGDLASAGTGRDCWLHLAPSTPLPAIALGSLDYEEWLAKMSSKFRQESRRRNRRLEDAGGRFFLAGAEDVGRIIDAFVELHGSRWEDRGGSNALVPGLKAMLADAAAELLPSDRLRLYGIEMDGRLIAINILLAAGDQVSGWNSGFDAEWGRYSPSLQLTLFAVADCAEKGARRISLGPGRMSYKARLADEEEEIAMATVVPRGGGYSLARLRLSPMQLQGAVSRRLPPTAKERLRRLARWR